MELSRRKTNLDWNENEVGIIGVSWMIFWGSKTCQQAKFGKNMIYCFFIYTPNKWIQCSNFKLGAELVSKYLKVILHFYGPTRIFRKLFYKTLLSKFLHNYKCCFHHTGRKQSSGGKKKQKFRVLHIPHQLSVQISLCRNIFFNLLVRCWNSAFRCWIHGRTMSFLLPMNNSRNMKHSHLGYFSILPRSKENVRINPTRRVRNKAFFWRQRKYK